jgi:hypothetical protein
MILYNFYFVLADCIVVIFPESRFSLILLYFDLGSVGIDIFRAANIVKGSGSVIGIDKSAEMLEKARKNAAEM